MFQLMKTPIKLVATSYQYFFFNLYRDYSNPCGAMCRVRSGGVGGSRVQSAAVICVAVTLRSCSLARFDGGRAWSASIRTLDPTGFDYDTRKLVRIIIGSRVRISRML